MSKVEVSFHSYTISITMQNGEDVEVEAAKKIIEKDALISKDGGGITEEMTFTSVSSFDSFWQWLSPDNPR